MHKRLILGQAICIAFILGNICEVAQSQTQSSDSEMALTNTVEAAPDLGFSSFLDGDSIIAGRALFQLAGTPEMVLSHWRQLIITACNSTGDIELAVLPMAWSKFDPKWSRREVALCWIADAIREAEPGPERAAAREYLLSLCRRIIEGGNDTLTPAHAFLVAARSMFYPNVLIEPESDVDEFLAVLRTAVDLEAVKEFNQTHDETRYYCLDRDLDEQIDKYYRIMEYCLRERSKETMMILRGSDNRRNAALTGDYLAVPTPENVLWQMRNDNSFDAVPLILDPPVAWLSYTNTVFYALSVPRSRQLKNIDTILQLSVYDGKALYKASVPVFDISEPYEKEIAQKIIDFSESRLKDPSLLSGQQPRVHGASSGLPIIDELRIVAGVLGTMTNIDSRAPGRTDLYGRRQISEALVFALGIEDTQTRIAALGGLAVLASLDQDCANIALRPCQELKAKIYAENKNEEGIFSVYDLEGSMRQLYEELERVEEIGLDFIKNVNN